MIFNVSMKATEHKCRYILGKFNQVHCAFLCRLKNSESLLYKAMEVFDTLSFVILSGTPVQNNLSELYALLSFVCPDIFKLSDKEEFLTSYKTVRTDEKGNDLRKY